MTRPPSRLRAASPYLLAGVLGGAGVLHFLVPGPFDSIVPRPLPSPRAWTYASGAVEMAVAAALVPARTRRPAALAAALLLVAVFPANVQHAVQADGLERTVALVRLPLQVPLVLWALSVRGSVRGPVRGSVRGPVRASARGSVRRRA